MDVNKDIRKFLGGIPNDFIHLEASLPLFDSKFNN